MKKIVVLGLFSMAISLSAFADPCRSAALNAAEEEYGNAPMTTKVKAIVAGREYHVAVGIGNAEDGEHDYNVVFPNGCDSKPDVTEIANY